MRAGELLDHHHAPMDATTSVVTAVASVATDTFFFAGGEAMEADIP